MTQRLLLIGGKTEIVRRASGLSSEVFLVQRPEQFEAIQLHLAKNIYFSQFASEENIVDVMLAIHAVLPFSAVISLTEHGMSVAAAIAHKLSLPRSVSPSSVDMTRDKLEMRRMLQRTGQHTCKFFEVNCRADLEAASAYLGYPFIVKPADGVGSVNVALISDATTVNEIAAHGRLIAEEFIPGDEYSVETFSFSGHHVLIGCTRKTLAGENSPGPFVEIAHEFPGPLSTGDIGAVREVVFSLLVNLGITDGPAHTEIKICNGVLP
jgi:biotin carboxylase